jgi:carboxymethylenebutenolidase
MVEFGSGASGYLAPAASGVGPGVVVIQEWWGLVPHIREVCDRFAAEGFTALAPDLYHGATTTEPDVAQKHMMELDYPRAMAEIADAIAFLRAHDATSGKVGVVGFCMGGALTIVTAVNTDVDAIVPFYGLPYQDPGYDKITCPVLGHWAEHDDDWASIVKAKPMFEALRARGVDATLYEYPGTGHAFFNDHRPEVHDADASKLAWERTIPWLHEKLA